MWTAAMSLLSKAVSRVNVLIHLPHGLGNDVRFICILFPFAWSSVLSIKGKDPDGEWLCFLDFRTVMNSTHNPISMIIAGLCFAGIILLFSVCILLVGSSQSECSLCWLVSPWDWTERFVSPRKKWNYLLTWNLSLLPIQSLVNICSWH